MSADVVFSIDATGSMRACLQQVRRQIQSTAKKLFKDIPDLRIGVIVHGDYEDRPTPIKILDLTDNLTAITDFIRTCPDFGGSWADECYELVLHEARRLTWRAKVPKVLCIIGDQGPHDKNYPLNTMKLDWRNELDLLTESNIKVYGVQCLSRPEPTYFYKEIAKRTGGFHLQLGQFTDVEQLIMAVCYKQVGEESLKKYVDYVETSGRMSRSTSEMYGTLLGSSAPKTRFKKVDLAAVPAGRFQVLDVEKDYTIKDFVEDNGAVFKKGRGFYQFTKRETVQAGKEVVLVDKVTGDMFSGAKARDMIGAPPGVTVNVSPGEGNLKGYDVFIQSTSVNRRLKGGTKFLYEVDDL